MKRAGRLFAAALYFLAVQLMAAESAPLSETLKTCRAVAYVRVTHVAEDLKEDVVHRTVTFTLCGRAYGNEGNREFEILMTSPAKADSEKSDGVPPEFIVDFRCIGLLNQQDKQWRLLRTLPVSKEDKLIEDSGADIGLRRGIDANTAVKLIERVLKQNEPPTSQPPPPPPARRNEPWNLFRASPLRRLWPYFPL